MDSSSGASSVLATRELLDAERFPRLDILRKKPLLLLPELESGDRVADEDMDPGGDWWCCWYPGPGGWSCCGEEGCNTRLGVGEGVRMDKGPLGFVCLGLDEGWMDWVEKELTEGLFAEG